MSIVLAALDATESGPRVLEVALALGEMTGATVEAVHAEDGTTAVPKALAASSGVPFVLLGPHVASAVLGALDAPDVIAAVLGASDGLGGQRLAGRETMKILERANKPIVLVPVGVAAGTSRPYRRLLVPLEGTEQSSRAVLKHLFPVLRDDVELRALHVFTQNTMPRILDHPGRDMELIGDEFLARNLPPAASVDMRVGPVGLRVAEACAERAADLVVLSWAQDGSAGHAVVIRDVLAHCAIPVLFLPVDGTSPPRY